MTRTIWIKTVVLVALVVPGAALAQAADDAAYTWLGGQLEAGVQTSPVGDDLVGELGVRAFGLRQLDRAWLQLFDASAGFRGGVLANQHPYWLFLGGRVAADVEVGHRFSPESAWSPYLGGRAQASLMVLGTSGVALGDLDTINASDGFGGVTLDGAARVTGGFSLLDGGHSVLLTAFLQEGLRAPRVIAPGRAFQEAGVSVRADLSRSWVAGAEVLGGLTFATTDAALGYTENTYHLEASGFLRKLFEAGFWLGLQVSWGRDSHHQAYAASKTTYDTIDAPAFSALLTFGFAPLRNP